MEVYVVSFDSNRTIKSVKNVFASVKAAKEWIEEQRLENICESEQWDVYESESIVSYEVKNPIEHFEWAEYKVEEFDVVE